MWPNLRWAADLRQRPSPEQGGHEQTAIEDDGRTLPAEVASVLAAHEAFGAVEAWQAEPDIKLPFHDITGESRARDVLIHARDQNGPFLIAAVEATADEPFGATIAAALASAVERKLEDSRSDEVGRIELVATSMLGARKRGDPSLRVVRSRLLAACAGVLCEAERRDCARALLLVHEYVTVDTSDDQRAHNAADLNTFVRRLSHGSVPAIRAGEICGPFIVPGAPLLSAQPALFIGKVTRNVR